MLVLTRKIGEEIVINDGEIRISVVQIRGNRVRLAIDAPQSVLIRRQELTAEIRHAAPVGAAVECVG